MFAFVNIGDGRIFLIMSNVWFARPVLFVADIDRSVDFYVKQLGFSHPWRYEEEGKARVAQVERQGCALILSSQWPDKVGKGLMFISLDVEVLNALRGAGRKGRGRERWALGLQAHGHSGPRPQRALLSLPVGRRGNMIENSSMLAQRNAGGNRSNEFASRSLARSGQTVTIFRGRSSAAFRSLAAVDSRRSSKK